MNESLNNVEKIFMLLAFMVSVVVLVLATETFAQNAAQQESSKVESTSQKEADSVAQADVDTVDKNMDKLFNSTDHANKRPEETDRLRSLFAIPWLKGKLEKTKVTTTLSNLATLKTAVRNFKMDVGDYPDRLEELLTTNGSEKWDGPYLDMKSIPKDGWDMDFIYILTDDTFGFDIKSYGADKKSGGDGVNKDLSCWGDNW